MIDQDDYDISENNEKHKNDNEVEVDLFNIITDTNIYVENKNTDKISEQNDNAEDDSFAAVNHEIDIHNDIKLSEDSINIENTVPQIDLSQSVKSMLELEKSNDDELKLLDDYTVHDLRLMARKLSLPTTFKEKNKVKQYRKEVLYNNIKSFLELNQG